MPKNRDEERYLPTDIEDVSPLDRPVLPSTTITPSQYGDVDVFDKISQPITSSSITQEQNTTNVVSTPVLPEKDTSRFKPVIDEKPVTEESPSIVGEMIKTIPRGVAQTVLLGKKTLSGALSLPLSVADAFGYDIPIIKALRDKYRDDAIGLEFALNAEKLGIAPELFADNSLRDAFFKAIQRKPIDSEKHPISYGAQYVSELAEQAVPFATAIVNPVLPISLYAGSTFEEFQKGLVEKGDSEALATAKALIPAGVEAGTLLAFGPISKKLQKILPYTKKLLDPSKTKLSDLVYEGAKKEALSKIGFETLTFQTLEAGKAGTASLYGIGENKDQNPFKVAWDTFTNIELLLQSGMFDLFFTGSEFAGSVLRGKKLKKLIETNKPSHIKLSKQQIEDLSKTIEEFHNLSQEDKQKVSMILLNSENKKARYVGTYLLSKTAGLDNTLGKDTASRLRFKMVEDILNDKPIDFDKTIADYLREDINKVTDNKIGIDPTGKVDADLLDKEFQDTINKAKSGELYSDEGIAGVPPTTENIPPQGGGVGVETTLPEEELALRDKLNLTKQTLLEGKKPKAVGFFNDRDVVKVTATAKDGDAFTQLRSNIKFEDDGNGVVPIVDKKILPVRLNRGQDNSIIVESMFDANIKKEFKNINDALDFVISDIVGIKPIQKAEVAPKVEPAKKQVTEGVIPKEPKQKKVEESKKPVEKVIEPEKVKQDKLLTEVDKTDKIRPYDMVELQDKEGNIIKGSVKKIVRDTDSNIKSIRVYDESGKYKDVNATEAIVNNVTKAYDKTKLSKGSEYVFTINNKDTNYKYKRVLGELIDNKKTYIKIKDKEGRIYTVNDKDIYKVSEKTVEQKTVNTESKPSKKQTKAETVAVGKKDTETEKIGAELKGLLKKSKAKETTTEEPKKQKTQKKVEQKKEEPKTESDSGRLSKLKGLKKVSEDKEPKLSTNVDKDIRTKAKVFSVVKDVVDNFFSGKKFVSVQAIKDYTVKTLAKEDKVLAEKVKNRFSEAFGKYFKNGKISEEFHKDYENFKKKYEEYFLEEAEIEKEPVEFAEIVEEPEPKKEPPLTYKSLIPTLKKYVSEKDVETVATKFFDKGFTLQDIIKRGVPSLLKEVGLEHIKAKEKLFLENERDRYGFLNNLNLFRKFDVKEVKVEDKNVPRVVSEFERIIDGEGYYKVIEKFLDYEYGKENLMDIDKSDLKLEAINDLFKNYLVEEIIVDGKPYSYKEFDSIKDKLSNEKGRVVLKLTDYFVEGVADILQRKSDLIESAKENLLKTYKELKEKELLRKVAEGKKDVKYANKVNQKNLPKEWFTLERKDISDEENELYRISSDSKTDKFKPKDFVAGMYKNPSSASKQDLPDYIIMTRDNNPRLADIYERVQVMEKQKDGGYELVEYYEKTYTKSLSVKYRELIDDLKFFLETGSEATKEVERKAWGIRPDFVANEKGEFVIDYSAFRLAIDLESKSHLKFVYKNINPNTFNQREVERLWGDYIKDIPSRVERAIDKFHGRARDAGNVLSIYTMDKYGKKALKRSDIDLLTSSDPVYVSERRKVSIIDEHKIYGYLIDKFVGDVKQQDIVYKRIELRGKFPKDVDFKDYLNDTYLSKLSHQEFEEVMLANNVRYVSKLINNNMNSIRTTIIKNNLMELVEKEYKKYYFKERMEEEVLGRFGMSLEEFVQNKELYNKHKKWFSELSKEQYNFVKEMIEDMTPNELIEELFGFYADRYYFNDTIGSEVTSPDLLGFKDRVLKKSAVATNKLEKLFIGEGVEEPLSKKFFENIDMEEFRDIIKKEAYKRYGEAIESNFKQEFNLEKIKHKRPVAIRVEEYGFDYVEGDHKIHFPVLDMYKIIGQDKKTGKVILQSTTGGLITGEDGRGLSYFDLKENGFILTSMDHVEAGKFGSVFLSVNENIDAKGDKIKSDRRLTEQQMEEVVKLLQKSRSVILYNTEDDLPNYMKEALKQRVTSLYGKDDLSIVEGFTFPNGGVGIILNNLTQERLGKVLKHELLHRGISNLLETKGKNKVNLFISALMRKFDIFNADELNEFLATKAEEVYKTSAFQNIKTTLKSLLAKYGNLNIKLTDEDVSVFLNKYIEEGAKYSNFKSYIKEVADNENNLDKETKAFLSSNIGNPIKERIKSISDLDEKFTHFLSAYVEKFGLHKELKNDEKAGNLTNISRDLIDRYSKLTDEKYLKSYLPLDLTYQEMKTIYDSLLKNNMEFEANVFYQKTKGLNSNKELYTNTIEKFYRNLSYLTTAINYNELHPYKVILLNDLIKYTYTYNYDTKTYKKEKRTPTTMEELPTLSEKILKIVFDTYDPKETNLNLMEYYLEKEVSYNLEKYNKLVEQLNNSNSEHLKYESYKKDNFDIHILSNDLPNPKEGQRNNLSEEEFDRKTYLIHTEFITTTGINSRKWCFSSENLAKSFYHPNSVFAFIYNATTKLPEIAINLRRSPRHKNNFEIEIRGILNDQEVQVTHYDIAKQLTFDILSKKGIPLDDVNILTDKDFKRFLFDKEQKVEQSSNLFYKPDSDRLYPDLKKQVKIGSDIWNRVIFNIRSKETLVEDIKKFVTNIVSNISKEKDPNIKLKNILIQVSSAIENRLFGKYKNEITANDIEDILSIPTSFPNKSFMPDSEYKDTITKIFSSILTDILPKDSFTLPYDQSLPLAIDYLNSKGLLTDKSKEILRDFFSYEMVDRLLSIDSVTIYPDELKLFNNLKKVYAYKYFLDLDKPIPNEFAYKVAKLKYSPETAIVAMNKDTVFLISKIDYSKNIDEEVDKLFNNIVKSISKDGRIPNYKNIPINVVHLGIGDETTSNKLIYRAHIKLIDKLMDIFNVNLEYFPFNTYLFDKHKQRDDTLFNQEVFDFVFNGVKHKKEILGSDLFNIYYNELAFLQQATQIQGGKGSDYSITLNVIPEEIEFTQHSKSATLILEDNIYKYVKNNKFRDENDRIVLEVYSPQDETKSKINIINNTDIGAIFHFLNFEVNTEKFFNTTFTNINITLNKNIPINDFLSVTLPDYLGSQHLFPEKLKKEHSNIFGDTLNITINLNDLTFDKKRYIMFSNDVTQSYNLKVTINSKNKIENLFFLKGSSLRFNNDNIDMQRFLTFKSDNKLVYEIPADDKIQLSAKGSRVGRDFAKPFEESGLSSQLDDIVSNFEAVKQKTIFAKIKEKLNQFFKSFKAYPYLNKTKEDLVLSEVIRRLREVPTGAYNHIEMFMKDYYTDNSGKKLTEDQIVKASVYITASDLLNSINSGVYTEKKGEIETLKKLPFGFNSKQEVERFVEIARNKLDQSTIEFIQKRNKVMNDVYTELYNNGIFNKSALDGSNDYLRRIVITTTGLFNDLLNLGMGEYLKYKKYGFLKERTGSALPYITDIRIADTSYLLQARALLEYYKLIDELKVRFNKTPEVKKLIEERLKSGEIVDTNPISYVLNNKVTDETGDVLTVFNLRKFRAVSFNDVQNGNFQDFVKLAFDRYAEELGFDKSTLEKIDSLLFDVSDFIIIPSRYKKTFDTISDIKKESQVGVVVRNLTNAFRSAHTYLPLKVLKWQFNNAFGDVETAIRYPKLLKEVPKAFTDLWDRYFSGKRLPKHLEEELERLGFSGTIGSGFFSRELANVGLFKFNRLFNGSDPKAFDDLVSTAKRYGLDFADVYKNFMIFRESVLRLASYRFFKKLLTENPNIKVYGASESKLIDALKVEGATGIDRASEILSRQLIGDYGHLSEFGQYLRSHLIPFYSFMEVNFRRQVRSLANIFKENYNLGGRLASPAFGLLKMFMVYGAILLWNKVKYPEENEKLKEINTNSSYLIVGKDNNDNLTLIPIQSVIRDFLEWFNLDNPKVFEEVYNYISEDRYLKAMSTFVNRPLSKVFSGIGIIKIPYELWAGRTVFPDIEKGVPIRDKAQYLYSQIGLEPVYLVSQYYTKKQPFNAKKFAGTIVPYRYVDAGESDYNYTVSMITDFLKDKGVERPDIEPVEKTNALYFYKRALKEKDQEVAEYWKQKYIELGGNLRGIRISMTKSDPIRMIPIKYRHEFLNSLKEEDKRRLLKARRWWLTEIRNA